MFSFSRQQKTLASQIQFHEKGLTILELILVLGIFALIAGVASVQLANFQRGTVLEGASKDIVSALRLAHDKAMLGEDGNVNGQGDPWGIRFANSTADTYASFYGATYNVNNVKETVYLSPPLAFTAPTEGNNTDVLFTKLSGTTTASTITITDASQSKTITVDASGRISAN